MNALKSKTIISAIIIGIVGAAEGLVDGGIIPAGATTYVIMGIGLLQAILRSVTTTALSDK